MGKRIVMLAIMIAVVSNFITAQNIIIPDSNSTYDEVSKLNISPIKFSSNYFVLTYINFTSTSEYIKLRSSRNREFSYYSLIPLLKNHKKFNISLGLNVDWFNISSKMKVTSMLPDTSYDKNKMVLTYLNIPLELKFKFSHAINLGIGFKGGLLLYADNKYKLGNTKGKIQLESGITKWDYGTYINIGWKFLSVFGSYNINSLFNSTNAPDINTWSIGLAIMI